MKKLILHRYMGKPPITVLLDDNDYERVIKYKWHYNWFGYAVGKVNGKRILLHRFILNAPKDKVVDHINGNTLDNRRSNLRLCSVKENVRNCRLSKNNSSGYPGVSFRKDRNKYRAYIMVNRKQIFLGFYKQLNDAVKARKLAELKYFKEFAPIRLSSNKQ